ncbi:hypothetical protein BIFGAL_03660 [Bifidobacterium gallicum DSM 20093 = LMG 11596]|uniref:Uncharacterized protein n=1 Tax=Bifidobacterium gallicum DSM 20093 = LMG 11596 TaxID=561180 RepID=D1NUY2_9BIFI|nr:hypothetical protein BIFGAL_03660 [Bifidobacterium gallicum DSM 20093 = LMG 11596]
MMKLFTIGVRVWACQGPSVELHMRSTAFFCYGVLGVPARAAQVKERL